MAINGFNKGDILFILGTKPEKLEIGDVIIFSAGTGTPIIHRIINIEQKNNEYIFSTFGDNNNGQLQVEKNIGENQIVGKAIFKIVPYLGWGKMLAVDFITSITGHGARYISDGLCEEN